MSVFQWAQPTNLRNNAEPVEPSDAATKEYVDNAFGTAGGPNSAVQFNSSNSITGSANLLFDGANLIVSGQVVSPGIRGNSVTITSSNTELVISTSGNIDVTNSYINNIRNPASPQDAATKAYVDGLVQGLKVLTPCRYATEEPLPAYTYNNGTAGVGATITITSPEPLSVDGDFVNIGDRILVKNEVGGNAPYNGIYVVVQPGDGITQAVLVRSTDNNTPTSFYSAYTFIQSGFENAYSGWICTNSSSSPVTIGTTPIVWVQFSQAGEVVAGPGIGVNGAQVSVLTDSVTIGVNNENQIYVLDQAQFVQPNIGVATGQNLDLSDYLYVGIDADVTGTVYADNVIVASTLTSQIISANEINASVLLNASEVSTNTISSLSGIIFVSNGNIDVDNNYVVNLADPVNSQDAATKAYVDSNTNDYGDANVALYLATNIGPITAPTLGSSSNDANVATTQFVQTAINLIPVYGNANVAAYLPTYTGNLTANNLAANNVSVTGNLISTTLPNNTNSNLVATTAFVQNVVQAVGGYGNAQVAQFLPTYSGNIANLTVPGNLVARTIADPANNSNLVATTAFVQNVVSAIGGYGNAQVAQFLPTYSGNIANLTVPGNLSAVTANSNTNTTQVATTQFVQTAIQNIPAYGNANVAAYLPTYSGNIANLTVPGNLSAVTANAGANTTQVATTQFVQAAVQAGQTYGNANVAAYLPSYTGNLNPGNIRTNNYLYANGAPLDTFANLRVTNTATISNLVVTQTNIAIGANADSSGNGVSIGANTQANANSVVIGNFAGNNSNGISVVAVGAFAAETNQRANAVAIGFLSGQVNQGSGAVALGAGAGQNTQGNNAVAIGALAGANSQTANSIIINASGTILNSGQSGLYVKPVRNDANNTAQSVYFNTATNELTYAPSPVASTYGNANVAAYLPTYTGTISANVVLTNRLLVASTPNVASTGNVTVYTASNVIVTGFRLTLKAVVGTNCVQMADVVGSRDSGGNVGFTTYGRVNTNTSVPNINIGVGLDGSTRLIVFASSSGANTAYTYEVIEFN